MMFSSINLVVGRSGVATTALRARSISSVRSLVTSVQSTHTDADTEADRPNFAVCFDIDGVLRRGPNVLPGAVDAIKTLTRLGVPHIFITNGGGVHEHEKALQLENQLNGKLAVGSNPNNIDGAVKNSAGNSTNAEDVHIHQSQMILAHTPMQQLVAEYADKRVLILGSRKEDEVARAYGFNRVVIPQQFARQHPGMYPFATLPAPEADPFAHEPIEAIMIFHDPSSWQLELQVCVDVLHGYDPLGKRYNGRDMNTNEEIVDEDGTISDHKQHIPIFNANEDFVFSSDYPHPRFAQGAFLTCLENLYSKLVGGGAKLEVQRFGKPHKVTFDFAHELLVMLQTNPPPLLTVSLNTDTYCEEEWESAWEKQQEKMKNGQSSNDDPTLAEKKEKEKKKKEYKKKLMEEEKIKRKQAEQEQEEWEAAWEQEEARIMYKQTSLTLNNGELCLEETNEDNTENNNNENNSSSNNNDDDTVYYNDDNSKNNEKNNDKTDNNYIMEKEETEDVDAIRTFDKIYMIGDNPSADIRGANLAGHPWHSILVRSGVFNGSLGSNDITNPGRTTVDDVGEAVDFILKDQGIVRSDI